jgi:hypothetical protein
VVVLPSRARSKSFAARSRAAGGRSATDWGGCDVLLLDGPFVDADNPFVDAPFVPSALGGTPPGVFSEAMVGCYVVLLGAKFGD